MKILHFAKDEKFILLQQDLYEEAFPGSNAWRIQGEKGKPFKYRISQNNTKRVSNSYFYSRKLRKESEDYDLLVVHAMIPIFAAGVKTVRPGICVLWIGWGVDYYHLLENQLGGLLLEKTEQIQQRVSKSRRRFKNLNKQIIIEGLKRRVLSIHEYIGLFKGVSLESVAERIDVYRVSEAEVELLKKSLPQLRADFCVHHYFTTEDVYAKGPKEMQGPNVLLGNSAAPTNNHIEAFDLLHKVLPKEYKILVPLGTGDQCYAEEICKIGSNLFSDSFKPIRNWLPIEEYNQRIRQCGYVLMNHRRQQAFGNINAALYKGAKVFLRPENPLYKFYFSMGIQVFSVEEFKEHGVHALQPLDNKIREKNTSIIGEYMSRNNAVKHIRDLEQFVIKKRKQYSSDVESIKTKKKRPSEKHPNRQAHNWLAYNIGDRFLQKYIRLYKGTIFDFGCGEAPYKDFFLKYADQYIGIDWADSFHYTKADIIADLNKILPTKSAVADTVTSISLIEHLCEPQTMLNEAFRILKSGGYLILQVPWQWLTHEEPYDYFRYTPYGLKYVFTKAGFVDVYVEPSSGFFSMFILKFNYFTVRYIKGPKLIRWIIKAVFIPIWFIGQLLAPFLDKFDRNWSYETIGYYITARKP